MMTKPQATILALGAVLFAGVLWLGLRFFGTSSPVVAIVGLILLADLVTTASYLAKMMRR